MTTKPATTTKALVIGPANCVDALGVPWRWARDFARAHGVPIWRVGGKTVIPAGPLLEALEREGMGASDVDDCDAELAARVAVRPGGVWQ